MKTVSYGLAVLLGTSLLSAPAFSLEKMSDAQLSKVNAKGTFNFIFENIEYRGTEIPGVAKAGEINVIGTDGSSFSRRGYQYSATQIGTLDAPLTVGTSVATASVNRYDAEGLVVHNGSNLGERGYLRIGYPELAAWNNVDVSYDAVFGNPTDADPLNPNIAAGGTASTRGDLGRVSMNNFAMAGSLEIGGIPEGYKIESVKVQDSSQGAASRQGLLLNIDIQELVVEQWLFEVQQPDGIYDPSRDMVVENFSLQNLQMKSATVEASASGWRFAYHDPQPFTAGEPGVAGHPDLNSAAYDPNFPKASLSFETQMPHGQRSESRMQGVTLDHLVFNLRTE